MKNTRALRATFISVVLLFAAGRLLAADNSDGVLNSGNKPIITFDASDKGMQRPIPKRPRPAPIPRPRFPGVKLPDMQ